MLNKLSKSINSLYGFSPNGHPSINSGPCGAFDNEFFLQWNSRFINQVKIGFVMAIKPYPCQHVFVKLPNKSLFDGGIGIHNINTYNKEETN